MINKILFAAATTFLTSALHITPSFAQDFIPIGNGYDCVKFSNGDEQLVLRNGSDYSFVNSKPIVSKLVKDRTAINNAIANLNKEAADFESKQPDNFVVKIVKRIYKLATGGPFPDISSQNERKALIKQMKSDLKTKKDTLNTYIQRINNCDAGQVKLPAGGDYIYPVVKVVGFKGGTEAYAGFILVTNLLPNKFSNKKPTGFNGCLKLFWKDGTTSGYYTGMGTEMCYGVAGVFQYATNDCNHYLKKGEAGYAIQKAMGYDTSDAGVNYLISLIVDDEPQAVFLKVPVDMGRDKAVKLCDKYVHQ